MKLQAAQRAVSLPLMPSRDASWVLGLKKKAKIFFKKMPFLVIFPMYVFINTYICKMANNGSFLGPDFSSNLPNTPNVLENHAETVFQAIQEKIFLVKNHH